MLYFMLTEHSVSHWDLKLENILLSADLDLKLSDFGMATKDWTSKTHCGTPIYMSPQIVLREKYDTEKADVFSCGVILYIMLNDKYPLLSHTDVSKIEYKNQFTNLFTKKSFMAIDI